MLSRFNRYPIFKTLRPIEMDRDRVQGSNTSPSVRREPSSEMEKLELAPYFDPFVPRFLSGALSIVLRMEQLQCNCVHEIMILTLIHFVQPRSKSTLSPPPKPTLLHCGFLSLAIRRAKPRGFSPVGLRQVAGPRQKADPVSELSLVLSSCI